MRIFETAKIAAFACSIVAVTACTPFTKVEGDDKTSARIDGSWTVMWSGGEQLKGVDPKPTIVINTKNKSVSGFDGCNNSVSKKMADLFTNGAAVVETIVLKGHVLMIKNDSAELRLGPTDQLQ